jgi:hypothetical protein
MRATTAKRVLTLIATTGAVLAAAPVAGAATQVPCSAAGAKHFCQFYPAGNGVSGGAPVQDAAGRTIGYLHQGSNYVLCQRKGSRVTQGAYYNSWWAWTDADNGTSGWVNAVYSSGGDNEGNFAGVPDCHDTRGQPPGGHPDATAPPAPPTPAPTPSPTPGPTPPAPPVPPPVAHPQACNSAPGAGDNVTRWNPVVVCVLGMLGQPSGSDVLHAIDVIIQFESSGNPNAVNNWDSNAQAGHPSKGLIQTIPTTFEGHRSPVLPDNIFDPAANLYAGLNYGIATYGSILDIPGVKSVLNGGGYIGYASAQAKGIPSAGPCGSLRAGREIVRLRAHGESCRNARRTVGALNRTSTVRHVKGMGLNLSVKARGRIFLCDVQTHSRGAVRVVSCQSGPRTYWWYVRTRKTRHS